MIFKNSARTAKKTLYFTNAKTNRLTLFNEIISIYTQYHKTRQIHNAELPTGYYSALKD
jgi:hypothetical protein